MTKLIELATDPQTQKRYSIYPSPSLPIPFLLNIKDLEEDHDHLEPRSSDDEGEYLQFIYGYAESASSLVDHLCDFYRPADRKNRPGKPYRTALASLLANVLRIEASHRTSYGYHRMNPAGFWRLQVSYKPFRGVVEGLTTHGYLDYERGFKEHTGPGAKAQASRFRATAKLLDLAADHGITPANWKEHFPRLPRPAAIPDPVVLKSQSTFAGKGKRMAVDRSDPIVKALAEPIDQINAFMHKQNIQPDRHYAFHRIFANGDRPGTAWDQGGRLYSVGSNNYQQDNGDTRAAMRINGEPVVEIDVKASHITILHALRKMPPPSNPDPYATTMFDRDVVKTFVNMSLGYTTFHQNWTADARKGFTKKREKKGLSTELPQFAAVKAAVLRSISLLRDWPDSPFRWGDLQFKESGAVLEAVHTLAMIYRVPALPVHDSIIVPASKCALAEQVLCVAFHRHIGVKPTLAVK